MRQARPNQSHQSQGDRGWQAQDPVDGGGCSQQISATCSPFCISAATLSAPSRAGLPATIHKGAGDGIRALEAAAPRRGRGHLGYARAGISPQISPLSLCQSLKSQSGRQDSNLRPSAPKAPALPSCATPRLLECSRWGVWHRRSGPKNGGMGPRSVRCGLSAEAWPHSSWNCRSAVAMAQPMATG